MSNVLPFAEMHVRDAVQLLIAARRLNCGGSHLDAFDVLAAVGNRQRKSALVAEAVEHFAGSVAPRGPVIFALVEKGAGLLALSPDRRRT